MQSQICLGVARVMGEYSAQVVELNERRFLKVLWQLPLWCFGEVLSGRHDRVYWDDRRIGDLHVLVKHSCGCPGCTCADHPHLPPPVVLTGSPKHKSFSAVIYECASALRFGVHKQLHANGDERFSAVVILSIDVEIG